MGQEVAKAGAQFEDCYILPLMLESYKWMVGRADGNLRETLIIFLLTHLLHNELDFLIYMANISGLAALLRICSSLSIFKLSSILMRYGCDSCDGLDGTIPGPIVGPTTSYTKIKDETGTDSYYPANLTAAGISFLKSQKKQTLSGLHIFPAKTFQIKQVNFAISDFMTNCTLDNFMCLRKCL